MKKLADKYADKGVVWLAVNSTKYADASANAAAAKEYGVDFPVLDDSRGRVGRMYQAKTTPDVRVIDAKGQLVYAGGIDDDPRGKSDNPTNHVGQALAALTAGKTVPTAETEPYGCSVKYAPIKDFTLTAHDGSEVTFKDHLGKIVVLEWTNWDCPFVKAHVKADTSKKLAAKYGEKDVVWLMVNSTHYASQSDNAKMVEKHGVPTVLSDPSGKVGKDYGARTTPHLFVLDPNGALVYEGAMDDNPLGRKDETHNYVDHVLAHLVAGQGVMLKQTKPYGCSVKYGKKSASTK
jgi:peroxiredoxin